MLKKLVELKKPWQLNRTALDKRLLRLADVAFRSAQLVAAIDGFQAGLTSEQNARLLAQSQKPDATSIITFMTQIDNENATRRERGVSSRLFRILESVHGFSGIVDTFVSSHPNIAALVWGSVKFVIYVGAICTDR